MLTVISLGSVSLSSLFFFFFNDTATTEIYTLSLHDALPICAGAGAGAAATPAREDGVRRWRGHQRHHGAGGVARCAACSTGDRKSTRLNSSHGYISYAVFCLKKKKLIQIYK